MKSIVYTAWDGTRAPFSLKRREIVDRFMDNIMQGLDGNMALAQMMWDGFPLAGMDFRVMGLEEMFQELQRMKQDLFERYSLDRAFDQPIDDLKLLLAEEEMTRREKGLGPPPRFEALPPGLVEKFRSLDHFPFAEQQSREVLEHWRAREKDILELFEFYSRYGQRFQGEEYLDFDQALELMRHFKSIDQVQRQIMNGELPTIDLDTLEKLLGQEGRQSMAILLQLPGVISDEGLARFGRQGLDLTPKGMRRLGELAFGKLYHQMKKDRQGGQRGNAPQSGEIEPDTSRPYEYGDRFDLDLSRTLLKALGRPLGPGGRIRLDPEDFQVRDREPLITSTTVVLLDLSWSMSWEGRFHAAKKVALALDHYVRTRFPKDRLHVVGFSTEARELKGQDLALAVWDAGQPYTNLQAGLRLAMKLIRKSGNRNNRVIVITDGQPTAYYDGPHLHVELPMNMFGLSPRASRATLSEVRKVTAQGMNIETFMLDDNPVLVEFTRQISRINGGRAVVCVPGELGELVLVEEIKRRGGR
ncbi:MAG: VWA domain-containing protein [Proteobacteria bacterium]|nr:VWA domain-containing protein [Pseudomonadota bacterium]